MNMKRVRKGFIPFLILGILLISAGCSNTEKEAAIKVGNDSESNIRKVLNEIFNGPGEELEEIYDDLNPGNKEEYERSIKTLDEYIQVNLKPYFSEEATGQDGDLVESYNYLHASHKHGYELNIHDITIEESRTAENSYSFTVEVTAVKNGRKDRKTIPVRGVIQTNEEGKMTDISYSNDRELLYVIEESERIRNIRAVLQNLFNGPDGKQEKLLEGSGGDLKNYADMLKEYNKKNFKPYLSDRFYEAFVRENEAFTFLKIAHPDYELKAEEITFEESDELPNSYNFAVKVSISDGSKMTNVKGAIDTDVLGNVIGIHYYNFENFRFALKKDNGED
ncbi:hypothetical protein [Halobacillus litoralis]|uniref:hypothetical protein n=1 Tax=Halobacillus litoralis TaxID=45668 RepID=UPI001CFD1370|nr:hypothetical protein [Halobacillus litoralis]